MVIDTVTFCSTCKYFIRRELLDTLAKFGEYFCQTCWRKLIGRKEAWINYTGCLAVHSEKAMMRRWC